MRSCKLFQRSFCSNDFCSSIPGGGCGTIANEETTRKAKRKQESDYCIWTNGRSKWLIFFYGEERSWLSLPEALLEGQAGRFLLA